MFPPHPCSHTERKPGKCPSRPQRGGLPTGTVTDTRSEVWLVLGTVALCRSSLRVRTKSYRVAVSSQGAQKRRAGEELRTSPSVCLSVCLTDHHGLLPGPLLPRSVFWTLPPASPSFGWFSPHPLGICRLWRVTLHVALLPGVRRHPGGRLSTLPCSPVVCVWPSSAEWPVALIKLGSEFVVPAKLLPVSQRRSFRGGRGMSAVITAPESVFSSVSWQRASSSGTWGERGALGMNRMSFCIASGLSYLLARV